MTFVKTFEDWNFHSILSDIPEQLEFLDVKFDFTIDPDHFIKWLEVEEDDITGDYATDVHLCANIRFYIWV